MSVRPVTRAAAGSRELRQEGVAVPDVTALSAFVDRFGDQVADVLWEAGLALVERAVREARDGNLGRWRQLPRGELRRFRQQSARGFALLRVAVVMQEAENERGRDLAAELQQRAADAAWRSRRRRRTADEQRAATVATLARRYARDAGDELESWQPPAAEHFERAERRVAELERQRSVR